MRTLLLAALSIICSVVAQYALKAGMMSPGAKAFDGITSSLRSYFDTFSNPYILTGLALYGLGALLWLSVLSKWDVTKAYPMVGLGFALAAVIGILLGEQMTVVRGTGIAMIVLGVFIVGQT